MTFKHLFITILLTLGFWATSMAQNFNAGVSLGVATSQIDGDGYGGFNKGGAIVGIWVERKHSSKWNSQLELRYIQKGSHEKDKELNSTIYRLRLNYFEILFTYGYHFGQNFCARTGLAAGYLASAQETDANGIIPEQAMVNLNSFEISGILGLQYQLAEHWRTEVRLTYSVFPICPNQPDIEHWRNFGPFNRVLELCAFYEF